MEENKVFIIAEAGVNHNGSMKYAKKLIDAAAEAGADAVKFQTFKAENLVCKNAKKASYQMETTDQEESQFEMLKKLELNIDMHKELIEHCRQRNIEFLSTPFDLESINLLEQLNVGVLKIPSGEITNLPYLREIGSKGKKIILSTGMSNMKEVETAVSVLNRSGAMDVSVLHCNTQYPTPMEDVNLNVIPMMKEKLGICIGYSDHTKGIEIPIAAVALGAEIIEKHFTLDRNMEGPDHKASLEPDELKAMISAIRNVEKAMGDKSKKVSISEQENIMIVRKSIVAKCRIQKGDIFCEDNLTVKRPGNGISPMQWDEIIGQAAIKNFEEDELIII